METNRDELVELASKVEGQAEEAEPELLIELSKEIEYRRDNVASMSRMLKGKILEEFGERVQRAFDESVEAAKVGQQKLTAIRARLDFHSGDSRQAVTSEGSPLWEGRLPMGAALPSAVRDSKEGPPPVRTRQIGGARVSGGQAGSADLANLL
jgi:hypothetical protein